jgi:hypothetical protein
MAESGKTIKRENFTNEWSQYLTLTGSNDYYVYVCAACWYVEMEYKMLAYRTIVADYWNGSEWINGITYEVELFESSAYFFSHNRDEGNINGASCHNEYPLWRLHLSTKKEALTIFVWAGNYRMAETTSTGEAFYYPSGKKIQSRGAYSSPLYLAGSSANDDYALNTAFNRTNRRGSQILASDDVELIYYPY